MKLEMGFELGRERLELLWDGRAGMFSVTLGPAGGEQRCLLGTHCDRAVAAQMFNWEAKAMQKKWEEA